MKTYLLEKHWNLLFTRCVVKYKGSISLRMLIDTGSTYTILPVEALESIGLNSATSRDKVRIATASSYIVVPKVKLAWIRIWGNEIKNFNVVAYTLPEGIYADGLVGMDLLMKLGTIIDIKEGAIIIK